MSGFMAASTALHVLGHSRRCVENPSYTQVICNLESLIISITDITSCYGMCPSQAQKSPHPPSFHFIFLPCDSISSSLLWRKFGTAVLLAAPLLSRVVIAQLAGAMPPRILPLGLWVFPKSRGGL